jgi:hypothetical protein
MKSFVIRAINKNTGEFIYSRTNNINQRLDRLRYNILSINGKGTAVFDRFNPFIGCELNDVSFEVYKQIDFKEQA